MKDQSQTQKTDLFKEGVVYLTLNSSFLLDISLCHGKMGCVLFFAHYARYSKSELYDEFAGELLDEVYKEIHNDTPVNFENGLCGIGWSIEYLVQNGFMEGDTDEILEDIDRRIMERDPRRISDLSLRRGLAGIAFYVVARLGALRENEHFPFDDTYLNDLKEALVHAHFSEKDEVPPLLVETYLNALSGIKPKKVTLPAFLLSSELNFPGKLSSLSIGLENGIAGKLLYMLLNNIQDKESPLISPSEKQRLFILNEESRAANYGIGTYLSLLTEALKKGKWEITVIHLRSQKTETYLEERTGYIQHIYIATVQGGSFETDWQILNKRYYRSALLLLMPCFERVEKPLFQLNYMQMAELASTLKTHYPQSEVIVTVHYTDWSFELLGNKAKLQEALTHSEIEENKTICKSIESEKQLLDISDRIIAIAQHSYNDLQDIYHVPENKLTLISHGLKDSYNCFSPEEYERIRAKYGFTAQEQLLVFAGRLDNVKGIDLLADTFAGLADAYPKLRLIIAGDGDYNNILSQLKPHFSRITFTGFVDKTTLYELFAISNIGLLPSLHEEFGFVALEMMMMGVPLVAGKTTGLSELVIDGENGITVPLSKDTKAQNVELLKRAIKSLLENPSLCRYYAEQGRLRYLQNFSFDRFKQHVRLYFLCDT